MKKELHIVSTGQQSIGELTSILREIHPYIDAFHVREKMLGAKDLFNLVKKLEDVGVPLSKIYINDRVDVAIASRVAGVQLGYQSLDVDAVRQSFPTLKLGCSVHSLSEALEKEQQGADFVLYGHIYETPSKPGLMPRGIDSLRELTVALTIPVIAIGGIHERNVHEVLAAGANGIAVLSAVLKAKQPLEAAKTLNQLLK